MNEMTGLELRYALEGLYLKEKGSWERTRLLAHVVAQSQSKKKLQPLEKWLPFWWERREKKVKANIDAETFIDNFDKIVSGQFDPNSVSQISQAGNFIKVGKFWRKIDE